VKPAPFEYHAPTSVDETLALLAEHGDDAKLLAGGQSLVPLLSMRLASPAVLVDLRRVGGLDAIRRVNGSLSVGSMVRERTAERSDVVRRDVPLLADALPLIGHVAIRTRGTVGGSIAHADPAAEIPAVAVALDATIIVTSAARGERAVPASEFFEGFWTSTMAADELLTAVRFPAAAPGTGASFQEAARRHGDFAIAGAGCTLQVADGQVRDARLVMIGVDATPIRRPLAEEVLCGAPFDGALVDAAVEAALEGLDPPSDVHGSSAYRRHVVAAMSRRAIESAFSKAGTRDGDGHGTGHG
jgi:carbon-monoxide dehydrogenase medium subunit